MELARSHRDLRFPDRLHVHRKGKPGQQDEQPLAHELRCFPNTRQVRPRTHPAHVDRDTLASGCCRAWRCGRQRAGCRTSSTAE